MSSEWIKSAVIYEIYPLTFRCGLREKMAGSDHYGTLSGISEKLGYLKNLNVDVLWLGPFYSSPLRDGFGYNVDDHKKSHPQLGSQDDFCELIEKAHGLGLRVIIDLVFSHTSDQHKWFLESQKSKDNPYSDYYVWAEPRFSSTGERMPPNNWLSMDMEKPSAWGWNEQRQQYYLHYFNASMPALNMHNLSVHKELLDVAEHWLKLGVDGFRLDAIAHMGHPPDLEDVSVFDPSAGYLGQDHNNVMGREEAKVFLRKLRDLTNKFELHPIAGGGDEIARPALLAEVIAKPDFAKDIIKQDCVDLVFDGCLTGNLLNFKQTVQDALKYYSEGGIAWAMSNHDVARVVDRCMGENARPEHAHLYLGMLACLPGSIILFQGEELGLHQGVLQKDPVKDPLGLLQSFMGANDACRSGIPWIDGANKNLWLAPSEINAELAPELQEEKFGSTLEFAKHFMKVRHQLFQDGEQADLTFLETNDPQLMTILRKSVKGDHSFFIFNFSDSDKAIRISQGDKIIADGSLPALDMYVETLKGEKASSDYALSCSPVSPEDCSVSLRPLMHISHGTQLSV